MTIPSAVQTLLANWHISYNDTNDDEMFDLMTLSPHNPYAQKTAKVVFLKDQVGTVQVIIPYNRMLNLNVLNTLFERELKAISPSAEDKLKSKHKIHSLPALPPLMELDSFIDEHLLSQPELYIDSGDDCEWIKIATDDFKRLTEHSYTGQFTEQVVDSNATDASLDGEIVNRSINQFTTRRIKQRLAETLDIPPLPETAKKIMSMRIDPDADTLSLTKVVELDPSMSAQIVSWARSPFYGVKGAIETVEEAIMRVLGFDLVINLALGLSLGQALNLPKEKPEGYSPFWQQAVLAASLMAVLARKAKVESSLSQGTAYLSGLLHNFGYLVLGHVFPPQFENICRLMEANTHVGRNFIEEHVLGMSREQISCELMVQWNMPDEISTAVRQQNNPAYQGEHSAYARLLYVSTRALRRHGVGDAPYEMPNPAVLESLGLTQEDVEEATGNIMAEIDELSELSRLLSR